jgi:hypothetical protein
VPANAMSFEWISRTTLLIASKFQRNPSKEQIYPKENSDEQQQP